VSIRFHQPDPHSLFASIVRRTIDDFVLVTAAITLAWYMNEQQASPIGGDAARLLIARQVIPGDGSQRAGHRCAVRGASLIAK
jgi:hypothetical protein